MQPSPALSTRDIGAMEQVWTATGEDTNIAPPIWPAAYIGWTAIRKNYESFWGTLEQLTVTMAKPTITIRGEVAWVHGIETANRRMKSGQVSSGQNIGTSIFVNQDGRWRMIFHQAAMIPKK
jgi:ketosteroid isomerase-like protein